METVRTFYILLCMVFLVHTNVFSQSVQFQILKGGKEIGQIKAHQNSEDAKTTYTVSSKASFRVLMKYVRETYAKAVYVDGELVSSDAVQKMNDNLKEHRITTLEGGKYACNNKGAQLSSIGEQIRFCTSMLYFQEPKNQTHIFAENYQKLCPIKKIEAGIYELTLPNGKINHYVYKSGRLEEIRVFRSIVDLVFKRDDALSD